MKQQVLYRPVQRWLEQQHFKVLITGERSTCVVTIEDLVPTAYKIPDLIGFKDQQVMIAEVEKEQKRFYDALGRCMLWKCAATFVYLAFPAGQVPRAPLLERLGIGLLEIDPTTGAVSEVVHLPQTGEPEFHRVGELHPLVYPKEQDLLRRLQTLM
jgi:hypothetical protein